MSKWLRANTLLCCFFSSALFMVHKKDFFFRRFSVFDGFYVQPEPQHVWLMAVHGFNDIWFYVYVLYAFRLYFRVFDRM